MSPATLQALILLGSAFILTGLVWLLVWFDRAFPQGCVRVRSEKVVSEEEALKALMEATE